MKIKHLFNGKNKNPSDSRQEREQRMQQRQYDYSRVLKLFQTHSSINLKEAIGTPPDKYYFLYHIDGLIQTGKSIEAKNEHIVEITLPERYPGESPKARMVTPLFHPNVSVDRIDLRGIWTKETPLVDCIVGIGELIAFQRYSTDDPLNSEAAQWALRNKSLLPLSNLDFGYREIEENVNAFMETKTEINGPVVEKENDAEQTRPIDDEDDMEHTVMENSVASDTVAIIKEEETAPPLDTSKEQRIETASDKPIESMITEASEYKSGKREGSTVAQNKDEVTNKDSGREKMINKPVSAQIGVDDGHTPGGFQENGGEAPVDRSRELKKTRFIAVEDNVRTVPIEHQKSLVPSAYMQSRIAQGGPYCPHCGSHVDDYANFCARCGSKLKIKSSQRVARIFFIVGMIAIPIIIFEVGSVIFLLNKKISAPSSAPETTQTVMDQSAALPPPTTVQDKRTVVRMEPPPVPEKPVVTVSKKEAQAKAPEPEKPGYAKVEARKPPAAVEAPKPAPAAVEAPKPAPAAVETPKSAPAAAEVPKPASAAPTEITSSDKKKAAVEGYLSQSEGTVTSEIAKKASSNQAAVNDNLKLARLYMGIGSYDDAIARYREVVKVDPYNQEAIQGLLQAKKMKAATSGK